MTLFENKNDHLLHFFSPKKQHHRLTFFNKSSRKRSIYGFNILKNYGQKFPRSKENSNHQLLLKSDKNDYTRHVFHQKLSIDKEYRLEFTFLPKNWLKNTIACIIFPQRWYRPIASCTLLQRNENLWKS